MAEQRKAADWLAVIDQLPDMATVDQVASLFGVHNLTVRRWVAAGRLQALRTAPNQSGRLRIPRPSVEALAREMAAHNGGMDRGR